MTTIEPETTADFLRGMARDAERNARKWREDRDDYLKAAEDPEEDHVYARVMAVAAAMRAQSETKVAEYLNERADAEGAAK